ncbi:iron chelate uptake ABC transporter family permease subunit [Yaniella sp.]|uniref:ABC transporter permease n=1 Tax=Yaniella sp. TaxID=2773929 RepID=UPI002649AFA0|nr:iron chelate uptake ABC transporter family permease subunit [Yaniella sp.]MDN6357706.1 iron chelate uptake ABC transporter family permease subunit [Yaniella sp.]
MWSRSWPLLIGLMVTISLVIASLFIGVYDLNSEGGREMFWITRVPRTIGLILSGASMAVVGLIMQLMTQNRFVEPSTTGTIEWAGLGLILTYVVVPQPSLTLRMIVAIVFSLIGTLIFFAFLQRVALKSSLVVPIVGLMLGAVVGAVSTFVALQTDMLQSLGIWFAGSFTGVTKGRYELLWIVALMTIIVYFIADRFTVAGLGQEIATSVGLNYRAVVLTGILIVAVVTGVVSVVVGSLPFLGLVVPNIVSMFRGDNLRSNLPWVMLVGIVVITLTDIIGRTIIMPFEIPVSMILGVFGATVFVYLIVKRGRRG